ncbi:Protein of unknown function DUF1688 [Plasmopara halstedii]|uniref:Uncharacterized protein n=1 Tax=Plasmopara halstedii TaxID=4781 RepID=A0A0P1ABI2_PLAHL|nr:Protein of unknown function DUF1688 [Plasmopara halstedii]CEG38278.1 Protein of unknown function DUF1688 [Plasmopara halstedii]|eukprot:XP_024574647.1 Protein of unknown function DUF1688 [Plasmopara halstedii]
MLNRLCRVVAPKHLDSVKLSHQDVYDELHRTNQEEGWCSDDGALRDGGALNLFSSESCGLLAQYATVGLMMGALPSTITPFLGYYLNMEGQVTTSARALLGIPWSVKVFIGILSDCFPICGFRRRPFMVIGWTLCLTCLVVMATFPLDKPYFPEASWRQMKPSSYTIEEVAAINYHAPATGSKYVVLMMLATLGYVIADVAADGVVVEYAQREPIVMRGRTQTAIYTVRSIFSIFGSIVVGFGLSSPQYGGEFNFGISFPMCMLILAVCCVPVIPVTWSYVAETRVITPKLRTYMSNLWETLQSRAVYQVIAYSFFSGVLSNISYVASDPVTMYWARATSFNISISQIIASGVTASTLALMGRYGLDWDWRHVIIFTTVAVVGIDAMCTMLTTWDIIRNQWFWLGLPVVESIPLGINFIVSSFVVVELANEGNEAAIYGLLTTVGNLSNPFSATLTKAINKSFAVSNRDILNDSHSTRGNVTIAVLISYTCKLLSLVLLVLLPRQKIETQKLKRNGCRSSLFGGITIAYCMVALTWSLLINLLGIFENTSIMPVSPADQVTYLRSLPSIRDGCHRVLSLAIKDQLPNFSVDETKTLALADYVVSVIRQSYPTPNEVNVPFHSRWRHFETGNLHRVGNMTASWSCDKLEKARRLLDLALVSVLLDAGAGPMWKYQEPGTQDFYSRSEGLGIASFHMFLAGKFSVDPKKEPHRVDAIALANLADDGIAIAFQASDANPLVGCAGRTEMLKRLGTCLRNYPEFFAGADGSIRPGNMVDYLTRHQGENGEVSITELWKVVLYGLQDIWPSNRIQIDGQNMGDVWELAYLPEHEKAGRFVSFHKLTQWLTYSLMEPLQDAGFKITDLNLMTGLPEYRNGGLLVDFGVLVPKSAKIMTDEFDPSADVIVEWRALTVALLDKLHVMILERLQLTADSFPLVKMLEGGTWKAGRIIAKEKRADGGSPIKIKSDGTVF